MALRWLLCAALVAMASACRCRLPTFPNCETETAILVKVHSYEVVPCPDSDGVNDYALAKVELAAVYKQADGLCLNVGDTILIRTAVQGATCGYPMEVGTTYLLFPTIVHNPRCDALETATNLQVSSCDGNIPSPAKATVLEFEKACGNTSEPGCKCVCESR